MTAMDKEIIDLFTLQNGIKDVLADSFPGKIWIKAEIVSVSVKTNGHCYLELSQTMDGETVAKARATIWRSKYALLSRCFREATGGDLHAGMTILARAQVTFSEVYGLNLVIDDLDAEVTLGEQERIRRETVARLEAEGMMGRQSSLVPAELPYRLAVISARDAAGFGDFCRHLDQNEYGFKFEVTLFEAAMQGVTAPESISDALDSVQTSAEPYDAVLILRGGGSAFDLACFDDYGLCFNIANCPVPVYTAIGHDRDYHVADMVAYEHVKTPTALADLFLEAYMAEDERISSYTTRLRLAFANKISAMSSRVELLYSRIKAADPRQILSRGYALATDSRGVVLKSASPVSAGDNVDVLFHDGKLKCTVDGKV